jgi:DNA-binding transcriptional LysR family regulator
MDLNRLRVFAIVGQERSFTRAARRLKQDKSQVSRAVGALEQALDVRLLVRTTRDVRLTAEGEVLLARVGHLLAEIESAVEAVPSKASLPAGEVAITATPDLGRALLAPALASFRPRFPAVRVRVVLASVMVDLAKERIDLALRVGHPGKSGPYTTRKLGELHAGFFASASYLERRGAPQSLSDLARHEGLWPRPQSKQRAFKPSLAPSAPAIECGDFVLLAELARLGAGVALLPAFVAARDVAQGSLLRVLPDQSFAGAPLYLVTLQSKPLPARIAALRDHVVEHVRSSGLFA